MFDPTSLLLSASYLGLFLIVFAETGLLVGFFLPGDSLLIAAGLLAAGDKLSLSLLILTCVVAAILGDSTGYAIGKHFGPRVFRRPDSRLFRPEYVARTEAFFARHGAKTLILARFVPIVRTFAPTLAGVGRLPSPTFFAYNVLGALLWGAGVPTLAYFLGNLIPDLDRYVLLIVGVVVVVSLIPVALEVWRIRKAG